MNKKIRIECEGAAKYPIEQLLKFQGKIKVLTSKNAEKLKKSILKYGFSVPIAIWKRNGKNHILDGHQRCVVLETMQKEGYIIPKIPVDIVNAKTKNEAKEKLIHIIGQYGEFDLEELDLFIEDMDIEFDSINIVDGDTFIDIEEPGIPKLKEEKKKKQKKCPKCGYKW
jgi:hypothetical protein